jgi:hypothetical protein
MYHSFAALSLPSLLASNHLLTIRVRNAGREVNALAFQTQTQKIATEWAGAPVAPG